MSSTTAEITVERDASERQRRLASAVRTLRTRTGGADGARLLLIVGGVLIPLGFVLILLVEQFARTALAIADYAAIMVHGRITRVGQPQDVTDEVSAAYLGAGTN